MGRAKAAQLRELAHEHGWLAAEQALPEDEAVAAALGAQRRPASTISTLEAHRARIVEWAQTGGLGRGDPCGAQARARLYRQLLGGAAHAGRHRAQQAGGCDVPAGLRARRGRAGGLRRRPHAHPPRRARAAHLGIRDDAVLLAPPVRGARVGPEQRHQAGLPPPRLRVVRRRAPRLVTPPSAANERVWASNSISWPWLG